MDWFSDFFKDLIEQLFGKKKKKKKVSLDGDLPFDWDKLQVLSSGTENPGDWKIAGKLLNVHIGNTINYGNVEGGIPQWPTGFSGHNHCIGFVYQPEHLKASRGGYYCTGEWGNPNQFVNDGSKPFMSVRGSKTFFSGPMKDFVPNGQEVWIIITCVNWLQQRTIRERLSAVKAYLTS